jgi:hypothetical protein
MNTQNLLNSGDNKIPFHRNTVLGHVIEKIAELEKELYPGEPSLLIPFQEKITPLHDSLPKKGAQPIDTVSISIGGNDLRMFIKVYGKNPSTAELTEVIDILTKNYVAIINFLITHHTQLNTIVLIPLYYVSTTHDLYEVYDAMKNMKDKTKMRTYLSIQDQDNEYDIIKLLYYKVYSTLFESFKTKLNPDVFGKIKIANTTGCIDPNEPSNFSYQIEPSGADPDNSLTPDEFLTLLKCIHVRPFKPITTEEAISLVRKAAAAPAPAPPLPSITPKQLPAAVEATATSTTATANPNPIGFCSKTTKAHSILREQRFIAELEHYLQIVSKEPEISIRFFGLRSTKVDKKSTATQLIESLQNKTRPYLLDQQIRALNNGRLQQIILNFLNDDDSGTRNKNSLHRKGSDILRKLRELRELHYNGPTIS